MCKVLFMPQLMKFSDRSETKPSKCLKSKKEIKIEEIKRGLPRALRLSACFYS